jgi:RNA polymerase sigma-70 factor (ECF subfamily)
MGSNMARSAETVLDELLVLKAQDGDAEAFSALVRRWQPRMYRYALRLADSHDLAADAVQDSWMAAARGIQRLEDPACFPRWIFQIVARKIADSIRIRQRQRGVIDRLASESTSIQRSTEHPERDEVSRLRDALQSLPPDRRELLSMYYHDGLSLTEISGILEIPQGTVKSRLHYARQELKQIFERRDS